MNMGSLINFGLIMSICTASVAQPIINWREITAKSVENGKKTDSLFIFNVYYHQNLPNEKDFCQMTITEIKNLKCADDNPAYIEKPKSYSSKDGLSCNVIKKQDKTEEAIISYASHMETTLIRIISDRMNDAIDFEGNSLFSYPNNETYRVVYIPLKSHSGFTQGSISCGKISIRTLKMQ